jgi:Fe2+ transport system protein B
LSIISKHIISIEFGSHSFNGTCDINKKTHSLKEKIFMNWNVQDEWHNDKKTHKVSNKLSNRLLGIFSFWILVFAFILFVMHFFMIECSYNVIDILIFSYMMCNMLQLHMGLR